MQKKQLVVFCLGLYTPTNRFQYRYLVEKKKRAKVFGWPRKKGAPQSTTSQGE